MNNQTKQTLIDTIDSLKIESERFQQIHNTRYNILENNCYQRHKPDIDRFVSCIKYHSDQLEYHKKINNFYQMYIKNRTIVCFRRSESDIMQIEKCKRDARIILDDIMKRKLN